jgi:tRNA pseudouridine32 synthase / 23S rRNA pseudouridine746 synthase
MQEQSSRQDSRGSAGPSRQDPRVGSHLPAVPPGEVPIIHASDRYVVVDKPAWMLSVPGKGPEKADCVAARVAAMFPNASGPLVIHRLDMETSGLMVLGLDADSQRELSGQFEQRLVEKSYVALLSGTDLEDEHGTRSGAVDLPLRADIENRPVQIVDLALGRPAQTRWSILACEIDRVRVRFEPVTGRTHQIRVHAAAGLRRPIIGDALYGGEPAERLMLHAAELSFLEPGSRRRVKFESRVPF